jgi:hypothetical protein
MSRLRTRTAIVAILALCAALLDSCGATPDEAAKSLYTAAPASATQPPVATGDATQPPPTDVTVGVATGVPSPTESPAEPTSVPLSPTTLPTSLPSDTPAPPSRQPTATPRPAPEILSFTANPTITQNLGDVVDLAWDARGQRAELCPLIATGPVACQDVTLSGEQAFVVDERALTYGGFALRAYGDGPAALATVELHPQCQDLRQWFFADPPLRCPAQEALTSYAAAQEFERGRMIWVGETDEFYVFYDEPDEQGFQVVERTIGLQLKPGASEENRVAEDPPPGLYEPVSGFGLLWRGEVEWPYGDAVRERLGWATAPEFGFDTAYQCSTPPHPRLWNCFLRGPDGEVFHLRPDSTAGVRILWDVW